MYIVCFIDCRLRSRVNRIYRKKFVTVNDAEIHYGLTLSDSLAELVIDKRRSKSRRPKRSVISGMSTEAPPSPPPSTAATSSTSTASTSTTSRASTSATSTASTSSTSTTTSSSGQPSVVTVEYLFRLASLLDNKDLEILTNKLFLQLALANNITSNPANFCSLSLKAMELLKQNNKNNLLYKFAFALCDTKPGTDEPVFPMDRMPFGLVEYQIEFFSCTHVKQVIMYMDCFFLTHLVAISSKVP